MERIENGFEIKAYGDDSHFEQFSGQIKGMKLVSNNVFFGPYNPLLDEMEQHLSIYSDGRVFFSGYMLGDGYGIKHKKNRSKKIKIEELEATYILSHAAMYFSKEIPLDLVLDVGDWSLELINADGKSFHYQGPLYENLIIDGVGISDLIRKYLKMPDLYAFDGEARFPIVKGDNEYIFVNVCFESSERTYCYLSDDELIQEGDEVIVPVGENGELKTATVESVEVFAEKNAPYPIEKCKKVIRRVI